MVILFIITFAKVDNNYYFQKIYWLRKKAAVPSRLMTCLAIDEASNSRTIQFCFFKFAHFPGISLEFLFNIAINC